MAREGKYKRSNSGIKFDSSPIVFDGETNAATSIGKKNNSAANNKENNINNKENISYGSIDYQYGKLKKNSAIIICDFQKSVI